MFAALALLVGALISINYLVNPFGAWRINLIDPIFRNIDQSRLATPYQIRVARPHTIVLGNSRVAVGMQIQQLERDGVYNSAFMGGRLSENARVIELALDNPNLKQIIWQMDFVEFDQVFDDYREPGTEARLDHPWRTIIPDTLLSLGALDESWRMLGAALHGRSVLPAECTIPVPWPTAFVEQAAAHPTGLHLDAIPSATTLEIVSRLARGFRDYHESAKLPEVVRTTIHNATARGVEVILFTPPLSEYELEAIWQTGRWRDFQRWKRELLRLGNYIDFSRFGAIARRDYLFNDVRHPKPCLGFLILRRLMRLVCRQSDRYGQMVDECGVSMTPATAPRMLAIEDEQASDPAKAQTRYAKLVEEALSAPVRPSFEDLATR
jgi:hypothetical protein